MAEYIERENLPQKKERGFFLDDDFNAGWNACLNNIASIPAADVQPVVRCKDCMYYQKDELGGWCFNDYENELRDEDFCSHGKRKESKT